MGVVANVGVDQMPKQGGWLGRRTRVCFRYDTSRVVMGTIVRDDVEAPWLTIISLDDGRVVLASECQHSPEDQYGKEGPAMKGRMGENPTPPAGEARRLRELITEWRRKSESEMQCAVDHGMLTSASVAAMRLRCADELEAALASSPAAPAPAVPDGAQEVDIVHAVMHEFSGRPCRSDGGWCDARDHAEEIIKQLKAALASSPAAGGQEERVALARKLRFEIAGVISGLERRPEPTTDERAQLARLRQWDAWALLLGWPAAPSTGDEAP